MAQPDSNSALLPAPDPQSHHGARRLPSDGRHAAVRGKNQQQEGLGTQGEEGEAKKKPGPGEGAHGTGCGSRRPCRAGMKQDRAGGRQRNKPQNMQKPFPLSRKINNRFINKFYKAVQLFKAF